MQANIHKRGALNRKTFYTIVFSSAFVVLIDWGLKVFALQTRTVTEPFTPLIPSFLGFGLYKNTGAVASIPIGQPLILAISSLLILFLCLLAHQQYKKANLSFTAAAVVVLLGAFNNFADRLLHGFTTDYLLLGPMSLVNLSDGFILFGVIWLVLEEMRSSS